MRKLIVIGLDGATFNIIKPWLHRLPNFAKIMKEGAYGILKSTIPPTTAVAWPSLYTGKNPGKHGIFYFIKNLRSTNEKKLISRQDIKADCIWDILSRYNKKSIIINCPITYPPKITNGIMISGMLTPDGANYVYPAFWKEKIEEIAEGYIIHTPQSKLPSSEKKAIKKMVEEIDKRFKVTKYLYEKEDWDFFMVVFQATDKSQHKFWHKKELIYEIYKRMDEIIGYFLETLDINTALFIVSDHGFRGATKKIKINMFLKEKGYLKTRKVNKTFIDMAKEERGEKKLAFLSKIGITQERIINFLRTMGLEKLKNYIPSYFRSKIPISNISVDYKNSIAYFGGGFGGNLQAITINKDVIRDYESVRNKLIDELKNLKDPKTGVSVIKEIYKREELYRGKYLMDAPDILFVLKNEYTASEFLLGKLVERLPRVMGVHDRNGIFLAYGNEIIKGKKINADITDIMPTILHYMNIPIPEDVDGKILKGIFKKSSEAYKRKVFYEKT